MRARRSGSQNLSPATTLGGARVAPDLADNDSSISVLAAPAADRPACQPVQTNHTPQPPLADSRSIRSAITSFPRCSRSASSTRTVGSTRSRANEPTERSIRCDRRPCLRFGIDLTTPFGVASTSRSAVADRTPPIRRRCRRSLDPGPLRLGRLRTSPASLSSGGGSLRRLRR